jgi:hypothetical protein
MKGERGGETEERMDVGRVRKRKIYSYSHYIMVER